MFLIYGTRIARRTVGYVAEQCPLCKKPTVCRVLEASRGGHFFFIPVGRGAFPLGHEARCLTCRHPFEVSAVYYHGFGKRKRATVDELIPLTSPWLGPLSAQEQQEEWRFRSILDVFMRYDHSIRNRTLRGGGLQFDWLGGLAILAMLIVPMVLVSLVQTNSMPFLSKAQATGCAWAGSSLVVIWAIYIFMTEETRFFRRQILPRMHGELAEIGATKADWQTALQRLKRLRFPLWRLLRSELRRRDFPEYRGLQQAAPFGPDVSATAPVWQTPEAPLTFR